VNIVYYTSGLTGTGRLVIGISTGNALRRNGIDCGFTILSSSPFGNLADICGHNHIEIPAEGEEQLSKENYHSSHLYKALTGLKPDVLIINHLWFTMYSFADEFRCKKIYISDHAEDRFFTVPLADRKLHFDKNNFDRVFAIEPFKCRIEMEQIDPLIIRNRDEIMPKETALEALNLDDGKKIAFYGFNGNPGDFEKYKSKYDYLKDVGYNLVYSTNYREGLFPLADYYNAFDLMICGAGYNQFWEVVYFNKEAVFETTPLYYSSQERRILECQEYYFEENGADQLAEIIMGMQA
jgi:hypothetical protein